MFEYDIGGWKNSYLKKGGLILFVRYLRGAGSSLLVGILIYFLFVPIHSEYIKFQLGMITLYVYVSCILGIALYAILFKYNKESKFFLCSLLYILLGGIASIGYWPLFFIFMAGSLVFYLVQFIQNKKFSIIMTLSGPILLIILLFIY